MNDENNILNEVKELFDIKAAANEDELLPNELGIEDGNVDFSEKAEDVKNKSEKFKKTALELKIFEKKTDLINSEKDDKKEGDFADVLKTRTDSLDLSTRTLNALTSANIRTLGGLARKKREDLLEVEGIGEKGIMEIKKVLNKFGLNLKE